MIEEQVLHVIQATEKLCPSLFSSYYLCGSQLDFSANKNSDIDLILVVENEVNPELKLNFDQLYQETYQTHNPPIGILVLEVKQLTDIPAYAKFAKLLYGSDTLAKIPLESPQKTLSSYIHGSYRFIHKFLRDSNSVLQFPVPVPDMTKPNLGYLFPSPGGPVNVKRLVSAIARISGALLVLKEGLQPKSKRDCIKQYCNTIKGEFSNFVHSTYQLLARDWEYELPGNENSIAKFREILMEFNRFENHFLFEIRDYLEDQRSRNPGAEWLKNCDSMIHPMESISS